MRMTKDRKSEKCQKKDEINKCVRPYASASFLKLIQSSMEFDIPKAKSSPYSVSKNRNVYF